MKPATVSTQPAATRMYTLGAVSFLNARPLVEGLDANETVTLQFDVPSLLCQQVVSGDIDVGLIPVVDLWRADRRLKIVSDACIGSHAETLTVRVFSRVSPDRLETLHVDPDSHTSVVLARLLWRELYHRDLTCLPFSSETPAADAVLLIGDKVVSAAPRGYGFEVDLGGAWRNLTGLPFVFAVWAGQADRDFTSLAKILSAARDLGVKHADRIADAWAPFHGWPAPLARRYLCETLCYVLTPALRVGQERFLALADAHGLLSP
jgi:chorismate dehydratase